MSSEKFSLKWNDFEKNLSEVFRELKEDTALCDVTLACGDEEVSAHKLILSACSPVFKNIFKRHNHRHTLLYLHGFTFSQLQSVLTFMYLGEVDIEQDQLNSFLLIAEHLQVKGLTQSGDSLQQKKAGPSRPKQEPRQEPVLSDQQFQQVLPVTVKSETSDLITYSEDITEDISEDITEDISRYEDQHYGAMENSKGESSKRESVSPV